MPDPSPAASLLFLREEELRHGVDLLFLAGRDLATPVDTILAERGLDRRHFRILQFLAGVPHMPVAELLGLVHLTKQTLSRLVGQLVAAGLVTTRPSPQDRRQILVGLTETGRALERQLWEGQRGRIARAYRESGSQAVEGFRRVLLALIEAERDRNRFARPLPAAGSR
jgi:DNA-binding MarR family transcriptional regulator